MPLPLPVLEDLKGRPRFLGWEDGGDGATAFWGDFLTGVANRFPFLKQFDLSKSLGLYGR